jgi:DNA (cytosine-5)-methyltransferase 3A
MNYEVIKIKVLSLFDGMSCGMLAMIAAGIEVEAYDAYEIDKYAVTASKHNFPQIEQHGDVFKADFTEYEGYDFLIGGSPCTYWSIAQSPDKRETTASGMGWELFSQYVRALHEAQPRMFIYENNKSMSKDIRASITEVFGFEPICINSALVSAQNRQRLYWVGVRNEDGTYRKASIEQPADRGILLKDVLDSAVAWRDKAHAETATQYKGTSLDHNMRKGQRNLVAEPVDSETVQKAIEDIAARTGEFPEMFNPYNRSVITGKSPTLSTGSMVTSSCATIVTEPLKPQRIGTMPRKSDGKVTNSRQYRIYSPDGKAITQAAEAGGMGAKTGLHATQEKPTKEQRVYEVNDGMIEVNGKRYPIKLRDGKYIIRKLTVDECKRLQTVPEWYDFSCVSDSQAYKMLGNGWTVEVIAHLIRGAIAESENPVSLHNGRKSQ